MDQTKNNDTQISLSQYTGDKYNCLVSTSHIEQISPYYNVRLVEVKINPDPDGGEVFKVGSKKIGKDQYEDVLSPGKPALMKIANAASIIWDPNRTRVIQVNRDYVYFEAVGAMRQASGDYVVAKGSKEIDLTVIEEELYENNLKSAYYLKKNEPNKLYKKSPEDWAKEKTKSAMIQWRKNKVARAETGAILRVVRKLLSMKMQYSPAEMSKPFVLPHVDFRPDMNDPQARQMMMASGMRAATELFGSAQSNFTAEPMKQAGNVFDQANVINANEEEDSYTDFEGDDGHDQPNDPNDFSDDVPPMMSEETQQEIKPKRTNGKKYDYFCENENCQDGITEKVAEYSTNKFGRPLCFSCQNREREAQ